MEKRLTTDIMHRPRIRLHVAIYHLQIAACKRIFIIVIYPGPEDDDELKSLHLTGVLVRVASKMMN